MDTISPHPAANNLKGALLIISVSAITPIGDCASRETVPFLSFIEARGEAIPSWEAAVGMLIKCKFDLVEAILATSITLPPPTPKTSDAPSNWFCISLTDF